MWKTIKSKTHSGGVLVRMNRVRWLGWRFFPRRWLVGVYWFSERHLISPPTSDDEPRITTMELSIHVSPLPMLEFTVRFYYGLQEGFDNAKK